MKKVNSRFSPNIMKVAVNVLVTPRPKSRSLSVWGCASRQRAISLVLAFFGVLSLSTASSAHHSSAAEFQVDKEILVKGVITKVDWINPHIYIYLDAKDDDGKVSHWTLQSLPTRFFHQSGVTKSALIGQQVTAWVRPAKDKERLNYGWTMKLAFPDGRTFPAGESSPDTK